MLSKKIVLFLFFLIPISYMAQINLVPNPSFEDTATCSGQGLISDASGWLSFTDSPDYFNPCEDSSIGFSAPYTYAGYQQAYDGTAYTGILLYNRFTHPWREYIGIQLTTPLTVGQKYYVSFQASRADFPNCSTNKLGARFTTYTFTAPDGDTTLVSNWAHVYSDSLLKDTVNWVQIKGSFASDSAYKYIVIGNFFDDNHIDTVNCLAAYAFIDMVCVSTDSLACQFSQGINGKALLPAITISPNPFTGHIKIDFPALTQPYDVVIYNSLGQQIFSRYRVKTAQSVFDLGNVASGMLSVNILYGKQSFSLKVLKQ